MPSVRVRFAPSPTGDFHIGNARTALYNWLFARHEQGTFILRIEDTDRVRSTKEAIEGVMDALKWLGLDWDEGPYFQSERLELYRDAVEKLLQAGAAYRTKGEEKGEAVRFRMGSGTKEVDDLIHGKIRFDAALMEDFVILKADGFPTYNFACVIDDHDMGITHVIRGDDHISNTPKQLAVYEALGFEPPRFAHIPMIMGFDGAKLSKRHGAPFVGEYRQQGYLSDALVNFIALLGWSPGDDREVLSRDEMTEAFTLERVKKTASRFDLRKLEWLNSQYIKTKPARELVALARPFFEDAGIDLSGVGEDFLAQVVELYRERFKTLRELVERTAFFFKEVSHDDPDVVKLLRADGAKELLKDTRDALGRLEGFDLSALEDCLRSLCETHDVKFKALAQPMRAAITGRKDSAGLFEVMHLLGKEETLRRLDRAISSV